MMMLKLLCAFLLALSLPACASGGSDISGLLEKECRKMNVEVALVCVTDENGRSIFSYRRGYDTKGMKVTDETHMKIGSVSKLFVGTLILRLSEEGLVKLSDPVSHYIKGVPGGSSMTIRQLGNHTSGLPGAIYDGEFQSKIVENPKRVWSTQQILKYAYGQDPWFAPGQAWKYSNTNTILLAEIAVSATGKSFPELMKQYVFDPMGLQHTGFSSSADIPEPRSRGYRYGKKGHPIGYGKVHYDVTFYSASWTGAAGNMYSTMSDMIKAAQYLCQGKLLQEDVRKELYHWVKTGRPNDQYGFCIESWDGKIGHRGDVPGYQCLIAWNQKKGVNYSVLTNLSNTVDGKSPANEIVKLLESRIVSAAAVAK